MDGGIGSDIFGDGGAGDDTTFEIDAEFVLATTGVIDARGGLPFVGGEGGGGGTSGSSGGGGGVSGGSINGGGGNAIAIRLSLLGAGDLTSGNCRSECGAVGTGAAGVRGVDAECCREWVISTGTTLDPCCFNDDELEELGEKL